jgi:modulator of FtsH protease
MSNFDNQAKVTTLRASPDGSVFSAPDASTGAVASDSARRVLRNTHALLSMTILFSAGVAALSVSQGWGSPGLIVTLVGYFGLLFAVTKMRNSGWAVPLVFALTGFMGYTLGPMLSHMLKMPGGADTITMALAATGATFLGMSFWATVSKRDFSFMGGFLFAGLVIAIVLGIANIWVQSSALALAISAMVALVSAALILFETQQIVQGGQTNYVMATVNLYVSIFNLFTSLLSLMGAGGSDD